MARQRAVDLDTQLKDIRRQMNDQLGSLEFRMESKLSLLSEFQEFFKRRGEVEYEYARGLERLCERFEKSTKQRNIRNEVRSTFNLWSTLLAETRKLSRERASLAETMASEMVARLEIMAKDVNVLTKKCKEMCIEVQDNFLKELRDLGEQTKVYQHSCYNTQEAYNKLMKSREKVETARSSATRRRKAQEKELERQRQYKAQKHLVMKNRNDLLLDIAKCNAFSMQYFNMDIMDIIEYMDFDYHASFQRLATSYKEAEEESCEAVMLCAKSVLEQAKGLNFENDLHYFLSENPGPFTPPNPFSFAPYEGDDVSEYKVNTQDVFERAQKSVEVLHNQIQTLEIQREEDVKTVQHMEQVNLKKYQVTTVEDALGVLEEAGENVPLDTSGSRGSASLDRGLSYSTRGGQVITLSQRGKKDSIHFTLGVMQRRISRSDRLALAHSQLDILEKSLDEQKVPPVPVSVDAHGQSVPGEVPTLFGGDIVQYIKATGCEIPLIVSSCIRAIEKEGLDMEGLFRVPGPAAYTEELRKGFEEGRDPLLYVGKKVDIAAVASVLKGYFRELSTPLFPTDKYKSFISCTRLNEVAGRSEAVRGTLNQVDPCVVNVMRLLFRFLYKVSQHSTQNKMTSANLALVFGPTLTRAPPEMDPRQLHNDVPAVNMLIQLCIDHHQQVFGEDEEEAGMAMAPPPSSPPSESPVWPQESTVSPPPMPPALPEEDQLMRPVSPQEPTLTSPSLPPPPQEAMSPPSRDSASPPPPPVAPQPSQNEGAEQPAASQQAAVGKEEEEGGKEETTRKKLGEQESGASLSTEWSVLDEQVKGIQASLEELREEKEVEEGEKGDGSDVDSDSEEEGEDVMSVSARALYDYTARSDKELSFKRGQTLKVIEKSADGHWWDGLNGPRRGFIPVAYVEIIEFQTTTPTTETMAIPTPPVRRSSVQDKEEEGEGGGVKVSEPPTESTIEELREPSAPRSREPSHSPEPPTVTLTAEPSVNQEQTMAEEVVQVKESSPAAEQKPKEEPPKEQSAHKPPLPIHSGAVRSLTQQFTSPPPQQVLVQPHRRAHPELSPRKSYEPPSTKTSLEPDSINRSSSASGGSSRVTHLTSQLEQKVPAGPPPPTRPRPPPTVHSPSADKGASAFHITPHSSTTGSPLQRAQLGSQVPPSRPPPKGAPGKVKRDWSQKRDDRPPYPTKPLVKPPPPAVPSKSLQLQAELQAAMKRKASDK